MISSRIRSTAPCQRCSTVHKGKAVSARSSHQCRQGVELVNSASAGLGRVTPHRAGDRAVQYDPLHDVSLCTGDKASRCCPWTGMKVLQGACRLWADFFVNWVLPKACDAASDGVCSVCTRVLGIRGCRGAGRGSADGPPSGRACCVLSVGGACAATRHRRTHIYFTPPLDAR